MGEWRRRLACVADSEPQSTAPTSALKDRHMAWPRDAMQAALRSSEQQADSPNDPCASPRKRTMEVKRSPSRKLVVALSASASTTAGRAKTGRARRSRASIRPAESAPARARTWSGSLRSDDLTKSPKTRSAMAAAARMVPATSPPLPATVSSNGGVQTSCSRTCQ